MEVGGKNNAGAALVSCGNLLAEVARGESAGARVQLRVELFQGRDAVGEHHFVLAHQRITSMDCGGVGRRCQRGLIEDDKSACCAGELLVQFGIQTRCARPGQEQRFRVDSLVRFPR